MRSPRMALIWLVGGLAAPGAVGWQTPPAESPARPSATIAPPEDPWSSSEIAAPAMAEDVIHRPPTARVGSAGGSPARQTSAWWRTSVSLAAVVALIVLLAWGYRLVTGAGGRAALHLRARHAGLIELLSRANLAPRQTLYLVRVGPQLILIGGTPDALRPLSIINDPDLAARLAAREAQRAGGSPAADFRQCLESEAGAHGPGDVPANGADDGAGLRRGDLRRKLAQALQRWQTVARKT